MRQTAEILLLVTLISGCVSTATWQRNRLEAMPASTIALLPALPEGPGPRLAAAAHATVIIGADAAAQSAGAFVDGEQLVLPSTPGGLEWAYYELPTNGYPVLGVEASLDLAAGAAYIGLSDYARGSWEFQQADAADFALPADDTNASPGGFVYLAVAAYDASTVNVLSVSIVLDQPGWVVHTVVEGDGQLAFLKLFADGPDGHPHIAYVNLASREVRLARSTVELPEQPADWENVLVDKSLTNVFAVALDAQFISAKPAVAYCDCTATELLYAYAQNAAPTAMADWTTCVVDDTFDALLPQISLCELALMPRLAYDTIPGELMLAASDSATPSEADWSLSSIAADSHRPSLLDFGLDLGVCFLQSEAGGRSLRYARTSALSPAGPADWVFSTIYFFNVEATPGYTALTKVRPVASWLPFAASVVSRGRELCAFQAVAAHPTHDDWDMMTLQPEWNVTVLAACTAAGRPAVAYTDEDSNLVTLALASTEQPAQLEDWQFSTVGANGGGSYVSVCEVAGTVAVAYFDLASLELRFAFMSP